MVVFSNLNVSVITNYSNESSWSWDLRSVLWSSEMPFVFQNVILHCLWAGWIWKVLLQQKCLETIGKFPVHPMSTVKLLLDCFTRGWIRGEKCLLRKSGRAVAQGGITTPGGVEEQSVGTVRLGWGWPWGSWRSFLTLLILWFCDYYQLVESLDGRLWTDGTLCLLCSSGAFGFGLLNILHLMLKEGIADSSISSLHWFTKDCRQKTLRLWKATQSDDAVEAEHRYGWAPVPPWMPPLTWLWMTAVSMCWLYPCGLQCGSRCSKLPVHGFYCLLCF